MMKGKRKKDGRKYIGKWTRRSRKKSMTEEKKVYGKEEKVGKKYEKGKVKRREDR